MTVSSSLLPFFAINSLMSAHLAADLSGQDQIKVASEFGSVGDSALPLVSSPALQADIEAGNAEDGVVARVRELFDARL
jgi:hypothetical protein